MNLIDLSGLLPFSGKNAGSQSPAGNVDFDALFDSLLASEVAEPGVELDTVVLTDDARERLFAKIAKGLSQVSETLPPDAELSAAALDRADSRMIDAVMDAFQNAEIEPPPQVLAVVEQRLPELPRSFETRAAEVLRVVAAALVPGTPASGGNQTVAKVPAGQAELAQSPLPAKTTRPAPRSEAREIVALPQQGRGQPVATDQDSDPIPTVERAPRPASIRELPLGDAPIRRLTQPSKEPSVLSPDARATAPATPAPGPSAPQSRVDPPAVITSPAPFAPAAPAPMPDGITMLKPEFPAPAATEIRPNVFSQIRSAKVGEGRTRIELSPANLGALEVELSSDESGQIRVVIRAESPVTLAALRSDRQGLADSLSANGINFDGSRLDFESYGNGERSRSQHDPDHWHRSVGLHGEDIADPEPEAPVQRYRQVPEGRLDILT